MNTDIKRQFITGIGVVVGSIIALQVEHVTSWLEGLTITANIIVFGLVLGLVAYVVYLFTKYVLDRKTIQKLEERLEELPKVHDEKNPEVVNDFLNHMKNDCFVSGISLGTFATGYQDKIVALIEKGKHFTFLLPHPDSKFLKEADDKIVSLDSRSELINELKRFNQMYNRLKGDDVNKMKVKFHHLPLVHSMLVVDPELEDDGKMDISLYDFNKDSRRRTSITIKKKHSREIFDKHYRSLKVVLDDKGTSDWDFKEFLPESNH